MNKLIIPEQNTKNSNGTIDKKEGTQDYLTNHS